MAGESDTCPKPAPALTRPIRWELITQQYGQMIKYAAAIRTRTASTEAILRRFTRTAPHRVVFHIVALKPQRWPTP